MSYDRWMRTVVLLGSVALGGCSGAGHPAQAGDLPDTGTTSMISTTIVDASTEEAGCPATSSEPATLTTPTGTLYGTLTTPSACSPLPVVLIIAGSGPTDRNGNDLPSLDTNAYSELADALADHGIASLRYDKRGIGKSAAAGPREADLRFEMYADDAAAWVAQLHLTVDLDP